jgi:hypothetical protein
MFVVARMPFDGSMRSGNPTAAHRADGGILGENLRQSIRELPAHCGNIVLGAVVFGVHGLPPTLIGPGIWPIASSAMGSRGD